MRKVTEKAIRGAFDELLSPYLKDSGKDFNSEAAERIGQHLLAYIKTDLSLAINTIRGALQDQDYREAWIALIAIPFMQEYEKRKPEGELDNKAIYEIAKASAENSLSLLCSECEGLEDPFNHGIRTDDIIHPAFHYFPSQPQPTE